MRKQRPESISQKSLSFCTPRAEAHVQRHRRATEEATEEVGGHHRKEEAIRGREDVPVLWRADVDPAIDAERDSDRRYGHPHQHRTLLLHVRAEEAFGQVRRDGRRHPILTESVVDLTAAR